MEPQTVPVKPKSNSLLMIVIIVLLLLILSVLAFIGIRLLTTPVVTSTNTSSSLTTSEENSEEDWEFYNNSSVSSVSSLTSSTAKVGTYKVYMFNQKKFTDGVVEFDQYFDSVNRSTTRLDVGAFVIEELIKGPTNAEKVLGLSNAFGTDSFVVMSGTSNCSGKDFTLKIENKVGKLRFCKDTLLTGDMSGSIVQEEIVRSLKQFPTITSVQVLNKAGNCFNDMSGIDDITQCIY